MKAVRRSGKFPLYSRILSVGWGRPYDLDARAFEPVVRRLADTCIEVDLRSLVPRWTQHDDTRDHHQAADAEQAAPDDDLRREYLGHAVLPSITNVT